MPKLDEAKERLGMLKFWLGVLVATFLSIAGWGFSNFAKFDENFYIFISAVLAEFIILFCVYLLNKKVKQILK